jgi:hypothetical protein
MGWRHQRQNSLSQEAPIRIRSGRAFLNFPADEFMIYGVNPFRYFDVGIWKTCSAPHALRIVTDCSMSRVVMTTQIKLVIGPSC